MSQHTRGCTLVAVDDETAVPVTYRMGTRIVRTPLDLIRLLDEEPDRVVLAGIFARERCFAAFIRETLPSCEVLVHERDEQEHEYAPALQLCYA